MLVEAGDLGGGLGYSETQRDSPLLERPAHGSVDQGAAESAAAGFRLDPHAPQLGDAR